MNTQPYSCTMPERRSKDHKHQLLAVSGFFFVAALLSLLTAFTLYPMGIYVLPALFAFCCTTASVLIYWAWWDVRNDG